MISRLLQTTKEQGLYRQRTLFNTAETMLNFSSNDYLSFSRNERVKAAFQRGFANYPSGSGGSMVVCGYHEIHRELEQAFAKALAADDALLFSSGYAANLAVISLLSYLNYHLLIDKGLHASFYDGIKFSGAQYSRFLHNDLSNLSLKLSAKLTKSIVVTETVFSMSGQQPNLHEMAKLCGEAKADLLVDEAHAFGIFGKEGLGAIVAQGLTQQEIPLRVIPFGKAFASQGAIVVGKGEWIDALLQTARSYLYSTALSPALSYGLLETFFLLRGADDRRQKLYQLIAYFKQKAKKSSLHWTESDSPIQQLQLGCPYKALDYAHFLHTKGIICQAMRQPTVSKKETGLRIILNYDHELTDIDQLFFQVEQQYESTH